ncbi:MAG: MFS transporter [Acidiferrobacterales bacterium]
MTSQRVIASYFTIAGLYTFAAALIWGVNTLFLLHAGLNIFEVFIANAAFTAGSVIFEIPTGVLADTRGRRASFLLSVTILLATTLAYVAVAEIGGGLLAFSVVSIVMGLGFTFYSGAVEAWLVDALKDTGYDGQLDRVFARGSMVTGTAMLIGTVSGGLLGSLDLSLPYVVRAAMLAAVFGVAFATMHDVGFTARAFRFSDLPLEMKKVARESIAYGWHNESIRLFMGCAFLQWGFITWGFYAWQPYFLELLGRDAIWVAGVVAALISLSIIAGNALVDWISQFCGRRTTLLLWAAALQTVAAVGIGLVDSFWIAVALLMAVGATMGITGPVKQAYLHQSIPSGQRASVISFDSMIGNAGGVVSQSGLGYLSRVRSIADGYVVGGLALVFVVPLLISVRRLGDRADVFVGKTAGIRGTCAPQGIPAISQVGATPVGEAEAARQKPV